MISKVLSQARRHATGAAWAVAEQGINPLVQLAITPVLLARLGKEGYGIWALAITLLSMSQLSSCGAGVSTTKHVSADLAKEARSDAINAIRAALSIAIAGGSCCAAIIWLIAPLAVPSLFANMGHSKYIVPTLALTGLAAAVQEIDNVYTGALRGAQRFDLAARIEVPSRVVMGLVLIFVSIRGANVHELFVLLTMMMALKMALKAKQVEVLFKSSTCYLPSNDRDALGRVFRFGVWQWLQVSGTVLFSATDQLLIGGLLGSGALTRYSICLQIAQYVHVLPSVAMQVVFPRISGLGKSLDAARGNEMLDSITVLALSMALVLGLPIITFAQPILAMWIGERFAVDNQWLLIILVSVHIALAFNIGGYFMLLGTGRGKRLSGVVLAAGAAQSVFALAAAPFGIIAVACNRFLYAFFTSFLYKAAKFKALA